LRLKSWHTNSIVGFTTGWLAGLWLGHLGWQAPLIVFLLAGACIFVARRSRLLMLVVLSLGLAGGIFYGHVSQSRYHSITNLIGYKATFTGVISDDPTTNDKGTTSFTLGSLKLQNKPTPGALTIYTYSANYQRGHEIQVTGKLQPVLGSKQAGMYATIVAISQNQSNLERWRQRFIAGINSNLPEPLNGFSLGLLIGARSLIPKQLQTQLTAVGLSHLVAVSGYNLTIIVVALRRILKKTSQFVALALAFWLIAGFVAVAGASASIVRAALVSSLSLSAYYYGRRIKPWVLVALPALATTAWKPAYLWSDVGWQLSFLAFIGILVVAPRLESRLRKPNWLKKLIIEATCAQVLTFPIILSIFHEFSVVGILANIIVLPLVPFAMLASLVAGVVGVLVPALGLLSWPAYLILKLIIAIIVQLAALPWASINLQTSTSVIVLLYLSLGMAILALGRHGRRQKSGDGIIISDI
jgi:competence protein ComEC